MELGGWENIHTVPLGWEFPVRVNVKKMWNLWYFGDKSTGIRPYPIFKARVFTNNRLSDQLRRNTILATKSSAAPSLKPNGIPPHLAIAAQENTMGTEIAAMHENIDAL